MPADLVRVEAKTRRNVAVSDRAGATLKLDQRGRALSAGELARVAAAVERRLPGLRWLMLAGSVAPGSPLGAYRRFARMGRRAGVPVLVDTSGPSLAEALEEGPALAKPNRREAADLLGREIPGTDEAVRAAEEVRRRGAERVVLSLGGDGAVVARCPVGSGDVLAAVCVWSLDRGDPFADALRRGVAAATVAASLPGLEFGSPAQV